MQRVAFDNSEDNEVDISGTITTADTAQTISAAKANRNGFWIQNLSAVPMYVLVGGTAVASQPSIKMNPDSLYESPVGACNNGIISIICSVQGAEFSAREW